LRRDLEMASKTNCCPAADRGSTVGARPRQVGRDGHPAPRKPREAEAAQCEEPAVAPSRRNCRHDDAGKGCHEAELDHAVIGSANALCLGC
jgi:hypothetical protein